MIILRYPYYLLPILPLMGLTIVLGACATNDKQQNFERVLHQVGKVEETGTNQKKHKFGACSPEDLSNFTCD